MEGRRSWWAWNTCIIITTVISLVTETSCQAQSDDWGPWISGQCSRSCGGGVQQSSRRCLTGRAGSISCQGSGTSYQSCNAQECPEGSLDFRAYQCKSYNGVPTSVKGRGEQTYSWKPYYDPSYPCKLICKNEYGDTKTLRETVIDGTPCDNGQSFGVCINGICKTTGCDHKIGSVKSEDKCLNCGGTGQGCRTVNGSTLGKRLNPGRTTRLVSFPKNATSLRIVVNAMFPRHLEVEIESDSGRSIKLTGASIVFGPRKIMEFAGTVFGYTKSEGSLIFNARGPIDQTLHLNVKYLGFSPMVKYEYSTKTRKNPVTTKPTAARYEWVYGRWTQCSRTCGHGYQLRAVRCLDRQERKEARGDMCPRSSMPPRKMSCGQTPCKSATALFRWAEGRWGECNVNCGLGEQVRNMICVETGASSQSASVSEDLCVRYAGNKPVYKKACRGESQDCPYWKTGEWNTCSVTCGRGTQTRRIFCQRDPGVKLDDEKCAPEEKPEERKSCAKPRCDSTLLRTTTTEAPRRHRGCRDSRFGCCPDGLTDAKGKDFRGCSRTVTSERDLCELPKERGRCSNYSVKWYFDVKARQCKRFWYGSCGGNDNRFDDRESCMSRCLQTKLKPEGCATSVFGCCSDNVTFARGDNGEGCRVGGCAGTRHGCCDDGFTSASGPGKQGCPITPFVGDCSATRHGCCGDGKTAARGPGKQGCPETRPVVGGCRGTRYGCCRDGRTAARGENYLGCRENPMVRCRLTRYGCCKDGKTPARGPDREGCPETKVQMTSCNSHRHGCCPDGVTFAQGPNQEGCAEFKPEYCGYEKDPGARCSDYRIQWFYSTQYGVCREFRFGGCQGNANRFQTKDDCQQKCVQVTGTDRCRLPVVKGPCRASMKRYHFDPKDGQCKSFVYGGCRGNSNNFRSHGECQAACNGKVSTQGTSSPCEKTPCRNGFACQDLNNGSYSCSCNRDWGKNCDRPPSYWCFSDDECGRKLKCVRERLCSAISCHVYARCTASSVRHTCDENKCPVKQDCVNDDSVKGGYFCMNKIRNPRPSPVVLDCRYSKYGCCDDRTTPASSPNKENCYKTCQNSVFGCCPDDKTQATGPDFEGCEVEGSGDVPCEKTDYGCCDDGVTAAQGYRKEGCEDATDNEPTTTPAPVTRRPVVGTGKCTAPVSRRRCTQFKVKWRYNTEERRCERHWWGGCQDNGNVFDSQRECDNECRRRRPVVVVTTPSTDPDFVNICDMRQDPGPCRASKPRFYYDPRDRRCKNFIYGGCKGNENNFRSLEDCRKECMKDWVPTTPSPTQQTLPPPSRSTMRLYGSDFVEKNSPIRLVCQYRGTEVVSLDWFKDGDKITADNRAFVRMTVTVNDRKRFEMNSDLAIRSAVLSDSGTYVCRSTDSNIKSRTVTVVQRQRPATTQRPTKRPVVNSQSTNKISGDASVREGETITITCRAQGPRRPSSMDWFINGRIVNPNVGTASVTNRMDREDRTVLVSTLAISDANQNNKGVYYCRSRPYGDLQKMTIKVLDRRVPVTEAPVTRVTAVVSPTASSGDVCTMPEEIGRCRASIQRWRYDHNEGRCKQFIYGGCGGNSNNFETQADCEGYCKARDICFKPKEVGRCRAAKPRFYYDQREKKCKQFIYGGCDANANNFMTMEACERKCNDYIEKTTPDRNRTVSAAVCDETPAKGSCRGYNIKWYYNKARNMCARFVYTGCDGNGNRFDSKDECQKRCVRTDRINPTPRPPRPRTRPTQPTTTPASPTGGIPSSCSLSNDAGNCYDYKILWYYDTKNRQCRRFYYGGCGGNANRFQSRAECEDVCVRGIERLTPPTTRPTRRPTPCQYTRYGCCNDGVTQARDQIGSNCQDNVVPTTGDGDSNKMLARPGSDVLLQCSIQSEGVAWYREGFLLSASSRFSIYNNGSLVLRDLTEDMAGSYACRYMNGNSIPQLERFKVEIDVPLSIVPGPTYINLKPGEDGFLHCQASGNPQPRVSWRRDGQPLRTTTRHRMYGNGTLIISSAQPADQGQYVCVAENGIAYPVSRTISLSIKESIEAKIDRHAGTFLEGETIRLNCEVRGYPTPSSHWEKEGRRISNENRRTVRKGELVVRSASIEDAGVYKCVASNDKGSITDYTTVQIKLQSPKTKCEDTLRRNKCSRIVAGGLCGFRMFSINCCQSCRNAGLL